MQALQSTVTNLQLPAILPTSGSRTSETGGHILSEIFGKTIPTMEKCDIFLTYFNLLPSNFLFTLEFLEIMGKDEHCFKFVVDD